MFLPNLNKYWLILLLSAPMAASGLPDDKQKPIELEADRAQYDQTTGVSVYEGRVIVVQGSMRLTADTMTIRTQDSAIQTVEAVGNPATFQYKPAVDKEEIHGGGQRVNYNAATGLIVVTEKARFTQGQDVFTGERVEYDVNKDVVKAGGNDGSRVKFVIQPKSSSIAPKKK